MTEVNAPSTIGTRAPLVALAGNPNTGKTTLFNRLTGSDLKVGNYPGVTVERHEGHLRLETAGEVRLLDVPGCYSLSARSEEEQIAVRSICGLPPYEAPDLVVLVIDATQLSRNLYLALQTIETNVPLVVALNMVDALESEGRTVDAAALEQALGVPVVPIVARQGDGESELVKRIDSVLSAPSTALPGARWTAASPALREDVDAVAHVIPDAWSRGDVGRANALALWALLSVDENDELIDIPADLRRVTLERRASAALAGREIDAEVIGGRYGWIDRNLERIEQRGDPHKRRWSERVDALVLHPAAGFVIFLTLMGLIFQSLFSWADPAIGWIELAVEQLAIGVSKIVPQGIVQDFLVDGLIAGVGSVVVFLPQILLLFFFLGLMEDSGYMARVAFLMDRVMKGLGLHGRAFVPMMSGFACAIPALMATRTIERRRDRFLTMMVIPLMTCAARLPVYSLIIGALFPPIAIWGWLPVQGLLMVAMYLFSTICALATAAVLSRTLFKGPKVPLILELPPYRLPQLRMVLRMMWLKSRVFMTEAGTVILVCTIALWVLLTFPGDTPLAGEYEAQRTALEAQSLASEELVERMAAIDTAEASERLRESYAGRLGQMIEPAIEPLGFDWKIGIGLIGSFAAREVFVATMGVVYGVGDEVDEDSPSLREKIKAESRASGTPVYTPLVGLSLMIFFALACQCMSTLAALKRETRSYRWPAFLFVYMTALAWGASFVVYQGGRLLGYA
ncbi:MAG: ferrous iron transport protein B [bacterium]|nr:ferrous iron transport protein B [bacterium]